MYLPQSYLVAVVLMFITMLCWGSWANTAKMDKSWRFELFYWDYSIGVFLGALVFAWTLGSLGDSGPSFWANLKSINFIDLLKALISGIIFNIANILLVAAITIAGMSVAFPIGIGIALVVGTFLSYLISAKGNPFFLFLGILLVLVAIILTALAYKKKEKQEKSGVSSTKKGLTLSIFSGILMSFFYPILADSIQASSSLTPYSGIFFFAVGLLICNLVVNYTLMKKPFSGAPLDKSAYFSGSVKQHSIGVFGGLIWCTGLSLNIIASTNAGPAIAYAFGQGATLIAAIWGVFVWKEFWQVKRVFLLLLLMFLCYLSGLVSIGLANLI
ncbi:MAG: L-rhamnose-proton symporter [Chlamydiae bacterium]|nr:L-rhamnose-proton symporter [Chlamydiota bacterium]